MTGKPEKQCRECGAAATDACPRGVEEACPRADIGKAKKPAGRQDLARPTPETFRAVADAMARGRSIAQVGKIPGMPSEATIWKWLRWKEPDGSKRYPEFIALIDDARQQRPDAWAEQLIEIADGKGKVPRDKLRVQTRQWLLERARPAEYGQRVQMQHSGELLADPEAGLRPIARALLAALDSEGLAELKRLSAPVIDGKVEDVEQG
jgi:hypothetical protein